MRNKYLKWHVFFVVLAVTGCNRDLTDDPIPYISFPSVTINLSFPDYVKLAQDGGYKTISSVSGVSIGVRGVIVYRKNSTLYNAFEVNCSYHPNDASANVSVHSSGLFLMCSGCGSNFNLTDGSPSGGVAWRPLRRYRTELSGSYLTITSDVVN
jgi:hypothetical protein